MKVTNGEVPRNEVPLTVRQPLLNVWLQAKQLASQSIGKGLGCDDDVSILLTALLYYDGDRDYSRSRIMQKKFIAEPN